MAQCEKSDPEPNTSLRLQSNIILLNCCSYSYQYVCFNIYLDVQTICLVLKLPNNPHLEFITLQVWTISAALNFKPCFSSLPSSHCDHASITVYFTLFVMSKWQRLSAHKTCLNFFCTNIFLVTIVVTFTFSLRNQLTHQLAII